MVAIVESVGEGIRSGYEGGITFQSDFPDDIAAYGAELEGMGFFERIGHYAGVGAGEIAGILTLGILPYSKTYALPSDVRRAGQIDRVSDLENEVADSDTGVVRDRSARAYSADVNKDDKGDRGYETGEDDDKVNRDSLAGVYYFDEGEGDRGYDVVDEGDGGWIDPDFAAGFYGTTDKDDGYVSRGNTFDDYVDVTIDDDGNIHESVNVDRDSVFGRYFTDDKTRARMRRGDSKLENEVRSVIIKANKDLRTSKANIGSVVGRVNDAIGEYEERTGKDIGDDTLDMFDELVEYYHASHGDDYEFVVPDSEKNGRVVNDGRYSFDKAGAEAEIMANRKRKADVKQYYKDWNNAIDEGK